MLQLTLAEPPEGNFALSWLVVVVSMVVFLALTTIAPELAPAGVLMAPHPATNRSSSGAANDRSVRPGLRIAAPFILAPCCCALSLR